MFGSEYNFDEISYSVQNS